MDKQDLSVGGPFVLVAVLVSVHVYSVYIIHLQPGQNSATLVYESLENVVCGLLY